MLDPAAREPGDELTARAVAVRDGACDGAELWAEARARLCRIALALGVPPDDVPDIVQDVLLAAHRTLPRFDPERGRFEGWLAAILVGRARNHRRGVRRRLRLLAAFGRRSSGPAPRDPAHEATEARLTLARLTAALTDVQREVVALYEIGDLTADEVARSCGMTAAGVRSIARDARRRLAALAAEEDGR